MKSTLKKPPLGYAMAPARPGESVPVRFREFTSTEDGQLFITKLEGIPDTVLQRLPTETLPSSVDNMLAIFHHDGKTMVYVNELKLEAALRAARPVTGGERVYRDDIADVEWLDLGVQVPRDAGFLFIFSIGWRKGLFYDFEPIGQNREPRLYDIARVLGQAYCHVLFQERFSISDLEWNRLLQAKWFPFVGLSNQTIGSLVSHVRNEWDPDEKLDDIVAEVKTRSTQMLNSWRDHPSFLPHIEMLERAVERFQNDDPMSCTSLLYSRIEGILRTHRNSLGTLIKPSQDNLSDLAVAAKSANEKCLLLPHRFNAYLRDVYFANFDPASPVIDVSRNSVGHGVASAAKFDQKSAAIGILIVHQLFYFLESEPTQETEGVTEENSSGTK